MEPWRPNRFFLLITVLIILLYSMQSMADPYEHCEVKKIITYDGKEIVSAEIGFVCNSKYAIDNGGVNVVELPKNETNELPMVVSLSEFYNDWMN